MIGTASNGTQPAPGQLAELLKGLDKSHVGAAMSKMISASIGDICIVMSKSPAYKFHTLADIEWLVLPAVLSGQYYVAELEHAEQGMRAPVACVTWASVSTEVGQRLASDANTSVRIKPDEWSSGPHLWIIHTIGEPKALGAAMNVLAEAAFKSKTVNVVTRSANGELTVENLHALLSAAHGAKRQGENPSSEPKPS